MFPLKNKAEKNRISYDFSHNGIPYKVIVWHDKRKHTKGTWELEVGIVKQENPQIRAGLSLKHLNAVLKISENIMLDIILEQDIKILKITGANNLRTKVFYRYITNRYPKEFVRTIDNLVIVDLAKLKLFQEV